jgi:hypothetical protein
MYDTDTREDRFMKSLDYGMLNSLSSKHKVLETGCVSV